MIVGQAIAEHTRTVTANVRDKLVVSPGGRLKNGPASARRPVDPYGNVKHLAENGGTARRFCEKRHAGAILMSLLQL